MNSIINTFVKSLIFNTKAGSVRCEEACLDRRSLGEDGFMPSRTIRSRCTLRDARKARSSGRTDFMHRSLLQFNCIYRARAIVIIGLLSLTSVWFIYPAAEEAAKPSTEEKTKARVARKKYTIADVPQYSMQEIVKMLPYSSLASLMRTSTNMRTLAQQELKRRTHFLLHDWSPYGTGKIMRYKLAGHTDEVFSVAFSPDSKMLASASADKTIKLWDTQTGESLPQAEELTKLSKFEGNVNSVAFSPDGTVLASGAVGGVRFWDLKKETVKIAPAEQDLPGSVLYGTAGQDIISSVFYQVAFSPDGRLLATTCAVIKWYWRVLLYSDVTETFDPVMDNAIRLFDVMNGKELGRFKYDFDERAISFSPAGDILASAGQPRGTKRPGLRFRTSDIKNLFTFKTQSPIRYFDVMYSEELTGEQAGDFSGPAIRFWDISNRELLNFKYKTDKPIRSLAFSPLDNRQLAMGSGLGVFIVDLPHNKKMTTYSACNSVAYSPDGRLLAAALEQDGKHVITLFNIKTRDKILEFETPSYVNSVAFSPDGKQLAAGCRDGSVLLWKVEE